MVTTNSIIQDLLAEGLTIENIVVPGGAKGLITSISDDFDAPLEEFADFT